MLAARPSEVRSGGRRDGCGPTRRARPARADAARWRSTWRRPSSTASSRGTCAGRSPTLLSGLEVGSLFEDQKVFDVVVWGTPELRGSVDRASGTCCRPTRRRPGAGSATSPTSGRAGARGHPARRLSRYVDVTAASTGGARRRAADVRQAGGRRSSRSSTARSSSATPPTGQAARARLVAVAVVALVLIFLLLQAALGSWRAGAVVPRPAAGRAGRRASPRCSAAASSRWARSSACSRWARSRSSRRSRWSRHFQRWSAAARIGRMPSCAARGERARPGRRPSARGRARRAAARRRRARRRARAAPPDGGRRSLGGLVTTAFLSLLVVPGAVPARCAGARRPQDAPRSGGPTRTARPARQRLHAAVTALGEEHSDGPHRPLDRHRWSPRSWLVAWPPRPAAPRRPGADLANETVGAGQERDDRGHGGEAARRSPTRAGRRGHRARRRTRPGDRRQASSW